MPYQQSEALLAVSLRDEMRSSIAFGVYVPSGKFIEALGVRVGKEDAICTPRIEVLRQ